MKSKSIKIPGISNIYDGLFILDDDGDYYLGMDPYEDANFKEIPEKLYTLIKDYVESCHSDERNLCEVVEQKDR